MEKNNNITSNNNKYFQEEKPKPFFNWENPKLFPKKKNKFQKFSTLFYSFLFFIIGIIIFLLAHVTNIK